MTQDPASDRLQASAFKFGTSEDAFSARVPIMHRDDGPVGSLVPVGPWALSGHGIPEAITSWRVRFNKMFPTQTDVTVESTTAHLESRSIQDDGSILFLIYTDTDDLIGHLGVARLNDEMFELVNLVRGAKGGHADLIYCAEVALLDFVFSFGQHDTCCAEAMSFNWRVLKLHERVGFKTAGSHPLRKIENEKGVFHEIVSPADANVDYTVSYLELDVATFAQAREVDANDVE